MNNELFNALNKLKSGELSNPIAVEKVNSSNEIAIIGMSVRLPHARNMNELYNVLYSGKDCISFPSRGRVDDVDRYLRIKGFSKDDYQFTEGAFLEEIDKFDYPFFKISAKEASLMDPLQRIFLETAWNAFEDAGYSRNRLKGTKTGVFLGQPHPTEYYKRVKEIEPDMAIMAGPGNINSIICSRIAYILDLSGISFTVDTACSSALVAVHLACQAIRDNECEMVLVGGINLLIQPVRFKDEEIPDIASSTGRAKTFSDDADGTGQGEGCIAIVLKSLDKAIRDKDNIHAIIKGSACNNDGASIGITAPSVSAQESVIIKAMENANVNPETISYVEAHGTGTKLGDPIEIEAITNAFKKYTSKTHFCGIGSVKTNYGHLDSAAGLLGLVKCVLGLKTQTLFPNINFSQPNRNIDFNNTAVYVTDKTMPWNNSEPSPRRCGISSFGLSGTNCHMILEEYIEPEQIYKVDSEDRKNYVLPISAKSEAALMEYVNRFVHFLKTDKNIDIKSFCYTAQTGRDHYIYRVAILGECIEDMLSKLEHIKDNKLYTNVEMGIYYGFSKSGSNTGPFQVRDNSNYNIKQLIDLAQKYVSGIEIDWKQLNTGEIFNKISIPIYPFEKKRCWLQIPDNINLQGGDSKKTVNTNLREGFMEQEQLIQDEEKNKILLHLKKFVANLFEMDVAEIDVNVSFFDLGIDSISIIQLKQEVKTSFNIDLSAEELFEKLNSLSNLADFIYNQAKIHISEYKEAAKEAVPVAEVADFVTEGENRFISEEMSEIKGESEIERVINAQLEIMSQQLQLLNGKVSTSISIDKGTSNKGNSRVEKPTVNDDNRLLQKFIVKSNSNLTENQRAYIAKLIETYGRKTQTSKQLAQKYRQVWANGRMTQGFSKSWKELIYPIFAKSAKGSKIYDVDGNEYVDFAMGFGVNLFGYNRAEIGKAIAEQLEDGIILGSLVTTPGEVAAMISEITGVERVAFCNSGTEAIMNAVRIARATTGKDKVALFSGSFHGTFDGIYVLKDMTNSSENAIPLSLGTPFSMVEDVIILEYADENALETIRQYADELAAVLVEPVQSRNPDLQPGEFLKALREITSEAGIALIFDEIITGFRVNIGGAQAFFDIEADIVTYGKVLGGGLPIGVFAGKSKFMDRVDGGTWNFSDNSAPSGFLAHTGGTFCHHPLAMAAAKATLDILKRGGNAIQEDLNRKTTLLANYLNSFFEKCSIPLRIAHFGSLFIFRIEKEPTLLRFLYYKLIEKGFYLWEGATCFISTAHTEEEIASFAKAVQECCYELVKEGCFDFKEVHKPLDVISVKNHIFTGLKKNRFLSESLTLISHESDRLKAEELFANNENIQAIYQLSPMQKMVLAQNLNYKGTGNDVSVLCYTINGHIDVVSFRQAWQEMVNRHLILRTSFLWRRLKEPLQVVYSDADILFEEIDYSNLDEYELLKQFDNYLEREKRQSFATSDCPLIKVILIKLSPIESKLILKYQNSLFDGWSSGVLFGELLETYKSLISQKNIEFSHKCSYMDYIYWLSTQNNEDAKKFWEGEFKDFFIDTDNSTGKYQIKGTIDSCGYTISLDDNEINHIKNYANKNQLTLYTIFQGAWALLHSYSEKKDDVIISTICSGRPTNIQGIEKVVGLFSNVLPVRIKLNKEIKLSEWLKLIQSNNLKMCNYEYVNISQISQWCNIPIEMLQDAIYTKTLVYLNFPKNISIKELDISIELQEEKSYVNVPLRVYIEPYSNFRIVAQYDKALFEESEITELTKNFKDIILQIVTEGF